MTTCDDVPMAHKVRGARWPIAAAEVHTPTYDLWSKGPRAFGSSRDHGKRRTVGVTISGSTPDVLVSPLRTRIVRFGPWQDGSWIVYLRAETLILGIGGLHRDPRRGFGIEKGASLDAGDLVGSIAKFTYGIHFQTWAPIPDDEFSDLAREGKLIWWTHSPMPKHLLNPTEFLVGCGGRLV